MATLDGSTALVTGSGQGIGRGIALALAAEGAAVTIADIKGDNAETVAAEIRERGGRALAHQCDIRDTAQVEACVAATVAHFGGLRILVNNAIAAKIGVPVEDTTDAELALALATGPVATLAFMRAAFPHLKGDGRIVNLRSGSEQNGLAGYATYIAAKSAVAGLTKAAAREWGVHGITVNAVSPFAFAPNMQAHFDATPGYMEAVLAQLAVKRVGDPEQDIGRTVVFLAGPDAGYITGCTIPVNGGGGFL